MLRLAITPGEPAGIGPDIVLRAATDNKCPPDTECVIIADSSMLKQRAAMLGLKPDLHHFSPTTAHPGFSVLHNAGGEAEAGSATPDSAPYVITCLECAASGCLDGQFHAMVTGPVNKAIIQAGGIPDFTGHTEFLANLAGIKDVVMMLACGDFRVALATTHLPLKEVPDAINKEKLTTTLKILHRELPRFFTNSNPKIAVTGLNPHAGENGCLGTEEITTIEPVIENCKAEGMEVSGPWPADTLFTESNLKKFDVALAMYHDQGLPVLKYAGFGAAANITLGLPFIRTSVDHGTALDLAGTGTANTGSLLAALDTASSMAQIMADA